MLALPDLAPFLWDEWASYARIGRCRPVLFLVMSDHVHGLFRFPADESMQKVVAAWKRVPSRRHGVRWQRDFFDHRIRNEEERMEKSDYIVMNPVRKGLVEDPSQWPFVWRESDLDRGRAVGASLPEESFPNAMEGRDASTKRPPSGRAVGASLPEESFPNAMEGRDASTKRPPSGRAVGASLPSEPTANALPGRGVSTKRPPSGRAVGASLPEESFPNAMEGRGVSTKRPPSGRAVGASLPFQTS